MPEHLEAQAIQVNIIDQALEKPGQETVKLIDGNILELPKLNKECG